MGEKEELLVTSNFTIAHVFYPIWHLLFVLNALEPLPKRQILDASKLKEFAEDNFKFDEIGRKFSKWVENTVGKGEIACYKQFLLIPRCFQKTCTVDK